jgi:hypothetical protein
MNKRDESGTRNEFGQIRQDTMAATRSQKACSGIASWKRKRKKERTIISKKM